MAESTKASVVYPGMPKASTVSTGKYNQETLTEL